MRIPEVFHPPQSNQINKTNQSNQSAGRSRSLVVFCDFDGTITLQDNIIAIMKHFNPEGWDNLLDQIYTKAISVREGVTRMFALLPSSCKEDIIRFTVRNAIIRDGFQKLLNTCEHLAIPFYVVSGGIDFFIEPLLQPYRIDPDHIFCNHGDFSKERIRIVWPHPCDASCRNDCGTCKPRIMNRFPREQYERIVIGDSLTDFQAAKIADRVFARSHLLEECETIGIVYHPFDNFHTVAEEIAMIQRRRDQR